MHPCIVLQLGMNDSVVRSMHGCIFSLTVLSTPSSKLIPPAREMYEGGGEIDILEQDLWMDIADAQVMIHLYNT